MPLPQPAAFNRQAGPCKPVVVIHAPKEPQLDRYFVKRCTNCEETTSHCNKDPQNCPVMLDLVLADEIASIAADQSIKEHDLLIVPEVS